MTLGETIVFRGNHAVDGAALQLLSISQVRLEDNLQLLFQQNSGRLRSLKSYFIKFICIGALALAYNGSK